MSSLERSRTAGLYALDKGQEKIKRMSEYRIEHVQKKSRILLIFNSQVCFVATGKDATDTSKICYLTRTRLIFYSVIWYARVNLLPRFATWQGPGWYLAPKFASWHEHDWYITERFATWQGRDWRSTQRCATWQGRDWYFTQRLAPSKDATDTLLKICSWQGHDWYHILLRDWLTVKDTTDILLNNWIAGKNATETRI